jgi:hypothetical protein
VELSERRRCHICLCGCVEQREDSLFSADVLLAVDGACKSRLDRSFYGSVAFCACACAWVCDCPNPRMGGARVRGVLPAIAVNSSW